MRFLCLIHAETAVLAAMTAAEREAFDRENLAYAEWLVAGPGIAGGPLDPPATATLIRSRAGQVSVTDGAYPETKEHIAGYILIEARDRAEAIEIASKCPVAKIGTLEVRVAHHMIPDDHAG
jgi:hypothetical protein